MNRSMSERLTCPYCHTMGVLSAARASKAFRTHTLRMRMCESCGAKVFTKATEEVLEPRYFADKLVRLEADMEREAAVA